MRNSVTLKLIVITLLMLLLLIPSVMIREIIRDRENLSKEATSEVSAKWANAQQLTGPVLTIPLEYETESDGKIVRSTRQWHILPEELRMDGQIDPLTLNRGIYEVMVYDSKLDISGSFSPGLSPDPNNLKEIRYDQAYLTMGITDLRGIQKQVRLHWNDETLDVQPGSRNPELIPSGITIDLPGIPDKPGSPLPFQFTLDLQGSTNLSFVPVGNTTRVSLRSPWPSPSFNGNFLPDERAISDTGFSASWTVLQLNRNFPQSWTGNAPGPEMGKAAFGVDLILPLDSYQKSFRSVKYAILTIALTFLVFFLVEVLNKRKIHPFQYALVGLALCLFYILLVSVSEHTGFNLAYAISAFTTISLIGLYSLSVFNIRKYTGVLVLTLIAIYTFLFVILQLADYALLMGSIGLTIILAMTMYLTRRIDWYRTGFEGE